MSQYKVGTVTLTQGSATVTGIGTLFVANVAVGAMFSRSASGVPYYVASITNDTSLELTAVYAGASETSVPYFISGDFTDVYDFPLLAQGDIDTPTVYNRLVAMLEAQIAGTATTPTRMPSGTVGAPGLPFAAELTTGIYRPATGQLGLSILGVNVATFAATALTLGVGIAALIGPATAAAFNTVTTTLSIGGAATTFNLGGTPTGGLTANLFTNATSAGTKTLNIGTGATGVGVTNVNIGSVVAGTTTVASLTFTLSGATAVNVNGASPSFVSSSTGTLTFFNTNLLTVNAFGAATTMRQGATGGAWAVGGAAVGYARNYFTGNFTSNGASTNASFVRIDAQLTGAALDTLFLAHLNVAGSIVTQGNTDTIGVVSSAYVVEPNITVGTGDTITVAATLYIANAPTEGATNDALHVASGTSRFLGNAIVGSAGWTIGTTAATGLTAQGNHRFAHGTSALATTATEGFLHLQSCAGPPTGVPASIPTGQIPMVYDSTNHRIYFYSGAWRSVAVA